MDVDPRSEEYSPPSLIQPFAHSQPPPSEQPDDCPKAGEFLQSPSSSALLSDVKPGSFVQLSASAAALPPSSSALHPPTQPLSEAAAITTEENPEAGDLKKSRGNVEWLPPTPVDSSNSSPSPSCEDNALPIKQTKYPGSEGEERIVASLLDADLWNSFKRVGNEMIVTKPGR